MILEGSGKKWNKNLQKQALAFDYGRFRDHFWDPVLDLFCVSFFKTYFLKRRSKAMDFQTCKWRPGQCFEELTWVTSAERCVRTYSAVLFLALRSANFSPWEKLTQAPRTNFWKICPPGRSEMSKVGAQIPIVFNFQSFSFPKQLPEGVKLIKISYKSSNFSQGCLTAPQI